MSALIARCVVDDVRSFLQSISLPQAATGQPLVNRSVGTAGQVPAAVVVRGLAPIRGWHRDGGQPQRLTSDAHVTLLALARTHDDVIQNKQSPFLSHSLFLSPSTGISAQSCLYQSSSAADRLLHTLSYRIPKSIELPVNVPVRRPICYESSSHFGEETESPTTRR